MSKKRKIESISFTDVDGRWMLCKVCQSEYVKVDEGIISTTCSMCVQKKCLTSMPIDDFFAKKKLCRIAQKSCFANFF